MKITTFSEVGGHAVNEDAFQIERHPQSPDCIVAVIADGQGGQHGGAAASRIACESVITKAKELDALLLAKPSTWTTLLRHADEAVREDVDAGYTTLVAVAITDNSVCGVSSGDSAALVFGPDDDLTLTDSQRKNPPVGSGAAVFIPFSCPLSVPWKVFLITDGVWKSLGWEQTRSIPTKYGIDDAIETMQKAGRGMQSGQFSDDFTIVAVEQSDN